MNEKQLNDLRFVRIKLQRIYLILVANNQMREAKRLYTIIGKINALENL